MYTRRGTEVGGSVLNLVLLAAKFGFLAVLYVFVFMVVRSAARDLARAAAPGPAGGAAPATAPAGRAAQPPATTDAQSGRSGWFLVVESSPYLSRGWAHPLPEGRRTIVGRAEGADVVLADTFVSSMHARLTAQSGGVLVEDLGSTNGTLVGERKLEGPLFAGPGDRVTVGDTTFRLEAR